MRDASDPQALAPDNIRWLGHDGFLIADEATGKQIYIDPYQLQGSHPPADLVLISHDHFDHLSADDLARIRKPETVFVTVAAAAKQLAGEVVTVEPDDRVVAAGIPVEAVPAYNLSKFRSPGVPFHPRSAGYVGFVVTVGGRRIYHTGDSDFIPEMAGLRPDVALLPVSGTYVMTADEAAQAAVGIGPRLAVPMHYGAIVGSEADARRFADLCAAAGIPVAILPRS